MGHAYANYFSKTYNVCYRKMPKTGKTLFNLKKNAPKNQTLSIPYLLQAQPGPCPTIIGLLLRFYNNIQTEWQLCRS